MCLAVPVKVRKINKNWALLKNGRKVSLKMVGRVKKGDYLLTRGDLAVDIVEKGQAKEILNSLRKAM